MKADVIAIVEKSLNAIRWDADFAKIFSVGRARNLEWDRWNAGPIFFCE